MEPVSKFVIFNVKKESNMKNTDFENVLNMSVAEFFEKMKSSGKYKVVDLIERGLFDDVIESYGDTYIDISHITDSEMLKYSPYRYFSMKKDCGLFYEVLSEGERVCMHPDEKVSDMVERMESELRRHYGVLFRNIKRVIDSGYRYILDRWCFEYEYLKRNAKKHGIDYVVNWEDCRGYMIIRDIDIEEDEHIEMTTYQYHRKK